MIIKNLKQKFRKWVFGYLMGTGEIKLDIRISGESNNGKYSRSKNIAIIQVGNEDGFWKTTLAHEMGHFLSDFFNNPRPKRTIWEKALQIATESMKKEEVIAWHYAAKIYPGLNVDDEKKCLATYGINNAPEHWENRNGILIPKRECDVGVDLANSYKETRRALEEELLSF